MHIVIKGLLASGEWTEVSTAPPVDGATLRDVESTIERILELVSRGFQDGSSGYIRMGNTIINISSFAAIDVSVVRDI